MDYYSVGLIMAFALIFAIGIFVGHKKAEDKIISQAELIRSLQEALKEAEARIEGLLRERG